MYGDKDGAYPPRPPSGGQWGTRSGPTRGAAPPEQAADSSSAWGQTSRQGSGPAWGQTPAWGNMARDASSARWESPASPAGPGGPVGGRRVPTFLRPPAVWFTGVAAVGSVVLVALTVLALLPPPAARTHNAVLPQATGTATPLPRPAPTATPVPLPVFALPAFHDWRAAYLASDGKVHVTTLDGQTDLTGPALSIPTAYSTNSTVDVHARDPYTSLAVAPNGRYLAYIEQPDTGDVTNLPPGGDLVVTPLAAAGAPGWAAQRIPEQVTTIGGWSPDSTTVAFSTNLSQDTGPVAHSGTIYTASLPSWQPKILPGAETFSSPLATAQILGWLDATHLVLVASANNGPIGTPPPGGTGSVGGAALAAPLSAEQEALVAVDITSGAVSTIATVPPGALAALSPDGTRVVAQYTCAQGCNAQALTMEVIDTRTGAVQSLPMSDKAAPGALTFSWNPQDSIVAATLAEGSTGPTPPQWRVVLVDAAHDNAQTVRTGDFAVGWSPDGSALLIGDGSHLGGDGTYDGTQVWAMAPGAGGAPIALPRLMVAFIGWVRTA